MNFKRSLCNQANSEFEWMYLVNETLEGEKCIVPLLKEIVKHPVVSGALKETVLRQIDEEVEHVRLFHKLIGPDKVRGSGFKEMLFDYVKNLDSVTLKLFSLQGLLEGIALGALKYRLENIENSPSLETDKQALIDECGHVGFSFNHFKHLIQQEGLLTLEQFRTVSRDVNSIFNSSFNGDSISLIFKKTFGSEINPGEIDNSAAMKHFRALSGRTIVENRNLFISKYFDGRRVC